MTKQELIKATMEYQELLNQFDEEYLLCKEEDDYTDEEDILGERIDKANLALGVLRLQLERMS